MACKTLIIALIYILMTPLISSSMDLGSTRNTIKDSQHVGLNSGSADGREGGENIETAFVIDSVPFTDTGNTSDNVDDQDDICPYTFSDSPDVVYSYTPLSDEVLEIDLCGSSYDTKVYVWDSAMNSIACNDDFYNDDICGQYVSLIENASLIGGETYYIFIDGYGGDSGDYILNVRPLMPPPFCSIVCDDDEGEPAIVDGYSDAFNNGCGNSPNGLNFSNLLGDGAGELVFGARSGWFLSSDGSSSRDTDWFTITIGSTGVVEWTLDAEQSTYGFKLGPQDCDDVGVLDQMLIEPCMPLTMTIEGTAGEVVWLWVGPSEYSAPGGFIGNEFNYLSFFTGLMEGTVPTNNVSFDRVKSLYR